MIDYVDLLGAPFHQYTCSDVVRYALNRHIGHDAVSSEDLPSGQLAGSRALRNIQDQSAWQTVERSREGDVLLTRHGKRLRASLDLGNGYALTSSEAVGVHAIQVRKLSPVIGIFRHRELK